MKFLNDVTLHLIKEINAREVFKKGRLHNKTETEMQLLAARRRIAIETLGSKENSDHKNYVKLLKSG